ncbi:TatD family hydrolase [Geoalkalibacter sp.]|uniref:TatD family hydrolase n=1 Tax=Geoalkalibacter sp. TaxID=3041440 RepID=UPI00272E316A|nr:TatD family hydrolase [Geoalkalibacter sp.]
MNGEALFFDTHAHLDCPPLVQRLAGELAAARAAGVGRFLVPGVAPQGWQRLLETVDSVPDAWAAPGIHPLAAQDWNSSTVAALAALLDHPRVVAVGEIGLDALLDGPSPAIQEVALRGQLRLAREAGLPVLIHCRRAQGRLLDILREERAGERGGILHAFSGSIETARQAMDLGFAIGFGGTLTYPNARRAPEVLKALPAAWVVLETDAPDIAPHPHRGEDNRPAWLALIAAEVARIRNWSLEETARITTENACRVLKITPP